MVELFSARYISLHVRETNFAAFHLYRDTLKFEVKGTEAKYYADGENAFDMRKYLTREQFGLPPLPAPAPAAEGASGGGGGGGVGAAAATHGTAA
jgi:peptide alpha-N-acetyltransferase